MAQKSREEGEIGSESREKEDLPPCSPPLPIGLKIFQSVKLKLPVIYILTEISGIGGKWKTT